MKLHRAPFTNVVADGDGTGFFVDADDVANQKVAILKFIFQLRHRDTKMQTLFDTRLVLGRQRGVDLFNDLE